MLRLLLQWLLTIRITTAIKTIFIMGAAFVAGFILICALEVFVVKVNPVMAVQSESMEPGITRGDVLYIRKSKDSIRVGEIIVYRTDGYDIAICHRVIQVHERRDTGEIDVLTKGDKNKMDDRVFYPSGQLWLHKSHIFGRAVWFFPYVGLPGIICAEHPIIKYLVLGLGFYLIFTGD